MEIEEDAIQLTLHREVTIGIEGDSYMYKQCGYEEVEGDWCMAPPSGSV